MSAVRRRMPPRASESGRNYYDSRLNAGFRLKASRGDPPNARKHADERRIMARGRSPSLAAAGFVPVMGRHKFRRIVPDAVSARGVVHACWQRCKARK